MSRSASLLVLVLPAASLPGFAVALPKGQPTSATAIIVRPAKFNHLPPGWTALDSHSGTLSRHRPASTYRDALSWRYRPTQHGWASQIPWNGIAVSIILFRGSGNEPFLNLCRFTPHLSGFPRIRRLPLRLPRNPGGSLEGAPNVSEYRVFGRMDESYNVDLRVDVNSPHPSRALLRRAQSVVSHVRFPTWPRLKRC
jgi:hypothetical protein